MPDKLDWAAAHGERLFDADIRTVAEDFIVTEVCDVEPSGAGEHDLLWVQKTNNNTNWVADRLAAHAGVAQRDVGFSGMKDRRAVTLQWFSVRRQQVVDWGALDEAGVKILASHQHQRKLRRGTHAANTFKIALRSTALHGQRPAIEERLETIASDGVPNYFGAQRFGRDGGNLDLARRAFGGRRLSRTKRGIAFSAARAIIFNDILERRVRDGSWNSMLPGELANLDGSGSVFAVENVDAEIVQRCIEHDIHPTASLWGAGSPRSRDKVAQLELDVVQQHAALCEGLVAAGLDAASRALRLRVEDLSWQFTDDALWLEFQLAKGGYATAVLQEIAAVRSP